MADVSFGQTFTQITSSALRSNFEFQFSQTQSTLIRRLNDEISNLNDDPIADIKIRRLQAEGDKLIAAQPVIEEFLLETRNTQVTLQGISDDLGTLTTLLGPDDSVTQDEIDAFTAERDSIASRINNLYVFTNIDVPNFDAVKNFKDQLGAFEALTPVVGTKADNLAVTSGVSDLTTRSFNAEALVSITVEQALDISLNIQKEFVDVDADLLEIESVAFAEKQAQIDTLKARTANLLQIFSLAFEGQAQFLEDLSSSLRPQVPEPGSILNLFA